MGRWGHHPLDNDTAADFSGDLDAAPESARIEMLQAALSSVPRSGGAHIDGGRAEVAIAAAAIAASNLVGGEEFQSEVWGPEGDMPPVPQDVIRLAAEVIDLLLNGDNDVKDDWSGDPGGAEWFAMMRRLHRVLAGGDSATPADQLW